MKLTKIYSGIMALLFGAAMLTACSDTDDYYANNGTLLTDGAVVTGSSDVTATTATFHGTVTGLENMNTASYSTGFKYGFAQNALTETATAASASEFSATLSGLVNNTTIYYQAFVTLQGKLTYTGEVKSLITTDATAVTGAATGIDYAEATLAGSISKYPADAVAGIVISTSNDEEDVRAGLRLTIDGLAENYEYTQEGLLPGTTYYYAAFLDLGAGVVYGEVKEFKTDAHEIDLDDDFVDLGVSVRWAKCNIGAKSVTDLGGYYAFGDLTGTNPSIDPADYALADTYRTSLDLPNVLNNRITLPTAADFEELFSVCTTEWTEQDGVSGFKVTGPNGNSIFLPAAGKRIAHAELEQGEKGYYLTGSVNAANPKFAVDYEFSSVAGSRATRAVYEAMAVRPVTIATKFRKELLYNTWYIDLREDGGHAHFAGPLYFYGTDDSWSTVTDHDPGRGDSWNWSPDWAGNSWIADARNYGAMTLNEDGTVVIKRIADDGTETTENGTYTVDEANKTISLSIDVLGIPKYMALTKDGKTNLKILSQSAESLQIAILRDPALSGEGACLLSFNYTTKEAYFDLGFKMENLYKTWHLDLTSSGSSMKFAGPLTFMGTDDSWNTVTLGISAGNGADSWSWCPDYAGNSWILNGASPRDFGRMTLREDGTVTVVRMDENGNATTESGTYTVNTKNMTISLSIDILGLPNMQALTLSNKTDLKLLSLTEETAQIAILRDPALSGEGACLLTFNYVTDAVYYGGFPMSYLTNTWHLDIAADGSSKFFGGPLTYMGTDDSWANITDGETLPNGSDSWSWCPDYAGNSWILGGDTPHDYGTMTFKEDGSVTIIRKAADGTTTTENGTYSVDAAGKTVTLSVDVLGLPNMQSLTLTNKVNLKVLSLTEKSMQIAILRDPALSGEGACLLTFNYVTESVYSGASAPRHAGSHRK